LCLSAVYEVRDGTEALVCEFTTAINVNGPEITLTDIMGDDLVIRGALRSIDLVKNIVLIDGRR